MKDQNYKEAVAAEWKEIRDMEEKKPVTTIDYQKMRVLGAWVVEPITVRARGVYYRREGHSEEEVMIRDKWNALPFYEVKMTKDSVTTDTADLALAIQEFEAALPGWWFSVGKCSITRDASCGPDLAYADAWLLKLPETRVFDEGFHCDDPDGSLASSLRNVTKQALEEKAKWNKQ
jgi:hypothetical protein